MASGQPLTIAAARLDEAHTSSNVELLISTMVSNKGSALIQKKGCGYLSNLIIHSKDMQNELCEKGGIAAVIDALNTHKDDKDVLEHGIVTICSLSRMDDHLSRIGKEKGVETVIDVMMQNKKSKPIQESSCCALANLARDSENAKLIMEDKTVVAAIIEAMERMQDSCYVQEYGCLAITYLAEAGFASEMKDAGGIRAAISAMSRYQSENRVQANGATAMQAMCNEAKDAEMILTMGGIKWVVDAVTQHTTDKFLQLRGCALISMVAQMVESWAADVWDSAVSAVITAMTKNKTDPEAQQNGCIALYSLAIRGEAKQIDAKGGVTAIFVAMGGHKNHLAVQMYGCLALRQLILGRVKEISGPVKDRGVKAAVAAMELHQELDMHLCACTLLFVLAQAPDMADAVRETTIDAMVKTMAANSQSKDIVLWSFQSLVHVTHDEHGEHMLRDHHGIEAIVQVMSKHRNDEDVQVKYTSMLCVLASLQGVAPRMCTAGAIDALCRARRLHPTSDDIQRLVSRTLEALKCPEVDAKVEECQAKEQARENEKCTVCGKTATTAGVKRLQKCGACTLSPAYCSPDCQKEAWPAHKHDCKANRKAK